MRFRLDARQAAAGTIAELARLVKEYPGRVTRLRRDRHLDGRRARSPSGPEYRVQPDFYFLAEAKALLGEASVV